MIEKWKMIIYQIEKKKDMDGCEKHQTMLVNGHTLLNMYCSKYNEENHSKYAFILISTSFLCIQKEAVYLKTRLIEKENDLARHLFFKMSYGIKRKKKMPK